MSEEQIPLTKWAENMQNQQKIILSLAKAAQQATDDFHIAEASERRTEFPINSYVLVKYRDRRPPSKLHSNWKRPLRVVGFTKSKYLLQDLVTKKESYHITQLKPFKYDVIQEFVVETVLNHSRGAKRGDYDFQIKWLGYNDPKDITW